MCNRQSKMQCQVVVLQSKGDTKQSKIEITDGEEEIPTRVAKILRKTKLPTKIGSWEFSKGDEFMFLFNSKSTFEK